MKISVSIYTLNLVFMNLLLLFFTFLSLSFLLKSKHQNLYLSTYELIAVVKSNRGTIFFIFHVTTMVIFLCSFKPYKDCDHHFFINHASKVELNHDHHQLVDYVNHKCFDDYSVYDDDDDYQGSDGYDEDDDDDHDDDDDYDTLSDREEDYEDKELLMRIEDFIAKNNNMWREESRRESLLMLTSSSTEILSSSSS